MLKQMRKGAHGVLAKLLIIALILSFAVWGVGDMVGGTPSNAVATVGEQTITAERYERAIERVRRSFGTHYTSELFNQLGVPEQVLNALINNALLYQEAEKLGVRLSDEALVERIRNNPDFSNNSGEFDRQLFSLVLRDNRLSEQSYLQILREELNISLLEGLISNLTITSAPLVDTYHRAKHETRDASILIIDKSDVDNVGSPENDVLEAMFAERRAIYQTPEYRTFSYITIDLQNIANQEEVTEAEVKEAYDSNPNEYVEPESRSIAQWLFANYEDAEKALANRSEEMLSSPAKAEIENGTYSDLGKVHKSALLEQAQEAVFSAKEGTLTQPIKTGFGWHVFIVRQIDTETLKPFSQVKKTLEDLITQSKRSKALTNMTIELEDAVAGGMSIEAIASEYDSKIHQFGPITQDGVSKETNKVMKLNEIQNLVLKNHFSGEEGQLSELSLGPKNNYFLVKSVDVIKSMERKFDEVKPILLKEWEETTLRKRKLEKASEIAQGLASNSKTLTDYSRAGIAVKKIRKIGRQQQEVSLSDGTKLNTTNGFVQALFATKIKTPTTPFPLPSGDYAVGVISHITPAKSLNNETQEVAEIVTRELNQQYKLELMDHYLRDLRTQYDVSVNDVLYREVANQ